MKTLYLVIIMIFLGVIPFLSLHAHALPPIPPQTEYFSSDTVVIGKVISSVPFSPNYMKYHIQVEQYLRNPQEQNILTVIAEGTNKTLAQQGYAPDTVYDIGQQAFLYLKKENDTYTAWYFSHSTDSLCSPAPTKEEMNFSLAHDPRFAALPAYRQLHVGESGVQNVFQVNQSIPISYDTWNRHYTTKSFDVIIEIKNLATGELVSNVTKSVDLKPCIGHQTVSTNFVPKTTGTYEINVIFDNSLQGTTVEVRHNFSSNKVEIASVLPPLQQLRLGTKAEDVKCNDLERAVKREDNSSVACVFADDLPKLVLRGWAENPLSPILEKDYSTQEQQDRFFYDVMNLEQLKDWSESGWRFVGGNSIQVGNVHFSQLQLYLPSNSGSPKVYCDNGWHADVAIDTRKLTVINATYPLPEDCTNQTGYVYREMELQPKGPNESIPNVIPTPTNVIHVKNSNYTISYDITGGMLDSAKYDKTRAALEIYLTANSNGDLVVTIPRQLLDSPQHIEPYQFFVMVDNYPVRYVQMPSTSYNTLTIPFSSGSDKIEISV